MTAVIPLRREVTVIPANPRLNRFSGREEGGLIDTGAYADVIIGINPENLENTGFCRFNPIFYARHNG